MGLAIAILLTLALAGSVLWVMPSPHEKRLTALRGAAMAKGVRVKLLDLAMAGRFVPWIKDHRGLVYYELPCQPGEPLPLKSYHSVRLSEDEWMHELDKDAPLRKTLLADSRVKALPASSEALVISPGGVALIWKESGELEVLDQIEEVLKYCLELDYQALQAAS